MQRWNLDSDEFQGFALFMLIVQFRLLNTFSAVIVVRT